jgi:transposase InsO family protein
MLNNCAICRKTIIWRERKKGLLKLIFISERAFAEISIDFITDFPTTKKKSINCLVVMDRLTKALFLPDIGEITAEATARKLYETFYPYYGIPRAIISDRGTQFMNNVWRYFCKLLNIKQRLSIAHHP